MANHRTTTMLQRVIKTLPLTDIDALAAQYLKRQPPSRIGKEDALLSLAGEAPGLREGIVTVIRRNIETEAAG